jgi:thiol-disulfide isomerase/thioredoxin
MRNLQRIYPVILFAFLIVIGGFIAGCTTTSPAPSAPAVATSSAQASLSGTNDTVKRVEVFHFHGTQQCVSCIAVGDLAEKTMNENFKNELESKRIIFAHVNYDLPENTLLAKKYGVTGSSLWIGVYNGTTFSKEENIKVWSLINNKEVYSTYLSGVITKRLNGDLS